MELTSMDWLTFGPEWLRAIPSSTRAAALEEATVVKDGTGRTVEAFAAAFDVEAVVRDYEGVYRERHNPTSFNRSLDARRPNNKRPGWNVGVFYNHALTLHGTPSERGSVPIGVPLEIRPERVGDVHGLLTVTRYGNTPLAEEVLDGVRIGALRGQSFTGRFVDSSPRRPRGGKYSPDRDGNLTVVTRRVTDLIEYGLTPSPVFEDAAVVGMRTAQIMAQIEGLSADAAEELIELLTTRSGGQVADGTPTDVGPAAEAQPEGHAHRQSSTVMEFLRLRGSARLKGVI